MSLELQTIIDLIRYGASRFNAAGLTFGHSYDNALDEATQLTLHALHLPHDLPPAYGNARVTEAEKEDVLGLFLRRIEERIPACYLTGEAWFAGLSFKSDPRALVPRSPIAELIEAGFQPWLGDREVRRALDLCTGSGCIAIAMAHYNPDWHVDGVDISDDALALSRENEQRLQVENVRFCLHLPPEDIFAMCESNRLEQVLVNLYANALDAMNGSDVRSLRVSVESTPQHVLIHVADTGPGLSTEVYEHLFEPFFTTKPQGLGLGLGLAISEQITRQFGGVLRADNAPGGGAIFTIELQIATQEEKHV